MHEILKQYLEIHGYWVLFIWTFLEGEAGLIFAGFLAFQGYFSVPAVMATSFAGAFCGDQFYFYLGRYKGPYLLSHSHFLVKKLRKGLKLIERYGNLVAFTSRFTYGFRLVLPIILGMTSFPGRRFLWLNLLSAFSWSIIFTLTGYLFGKSAEFFVGKDVKRYEHYLFAALAVIISLIWLAHFYQAWTKRQPARERLRRMKAGRMLSQPPQ
ncbi:MAG: DedA family protein [Geobacteraceae bacterium]|nr:DedA family protein [Geobacteraceae bacterium]